MRALVFTEPGQIVLREEPAPVLGPQETLVQVMSSGICGSELHGFRSLGMRRPPLIMGHEFAGLTPDGIRVVANPLLSCGHCHACRAGRPQICEVRGLLGVTRPGGFAEQVGVPTSCLQTLPASVGWTAAALIEPLANAVHAWGLAQEVRGPVAIIGAGSIGLVCLQVAQRRELGSVVVVEPSPERRQVAEHLGAVTVPSLDEFSGEGFEVIIDAVGLPETRRASVAQLRPGGSAVWIGLLAPEAAIDGNDLVRAEKKVMGSFAYTPGEFAAAVDLAGVLDFSWATDVSLSDSQTVFMELAQGRRDIIKAVLRPEH